MSMLRKTTLNKSRIPSVILSLALLPFYLTPTAIAQKRKASAVEAAADSRDKSQKAVGKKQPRRNIEALSFKDKRKAQEIRSETMKSLRKLLDATNENSRRYELLKRYGELYAEQSEYLLELEMMQYDKNYKKWLAADKKGEEPKVSNEKSSASMRKAVSIYREISTKYANFPGVDITLYELGKNLLRLNDEEGLASLDKLIKNHPQSQFVADAYFALGDYYFETKHDMVAAKENYQKAAKYKDNPIYPYAVYKLGWAHYNFPTKSAEEDREKFKKSIAAFKLVVSLSSRKNADERAMYLRQEAINDLIMVWAETEDVDSAWAYFQKIGDKESFYVMLERLGDIYVDQGKFAKATDVFKRIIREVPNRPSNPKNYTKLADIYNDTDQLNSLVEASRDMCARFLDEGAWRKANKTKPDVLAEARISIEKSLHRWASGTHKDAQDGNNTDLYKAASRLYITYLKYFPKEEKAYQLRFFLAEALFELEKFDAAATQYSAVVKQNTKDGKYLHEAALNAVISMNTVVTQSKAPDLPPAGQVKAPIAMTKERQKLVKAIDQYLALFPDKEDARSMAATASKLFYDHGNYDEAVKRMDWIAFRYPKTKQSEESIKLILGFYKDRKDWDKTIAYARKFLASKTLMKDELQDQTYKLLVFASFERALALEKVKPADGAEAFLAFQKEFPKDPNAALALHNAMAIYFKMGEVRNALTSARLLLKEYPAFEKRANVMITIAETYEKLADFDNAANYYAFFAKLWPKDPRSSKALFNAGVLYNGANKSEEATASFEKFLATYPETEPAFDARVQLAALYEKTQQNEKALSMHQTISQDSKPENTDQVLLSKTKLALAEQKAMDKPSPKVGDLRLLLLRKGAPAAMDARDLLSKDLLDRIAPAIERFTSNPVPKDKDLEAAIGAKQKELVQSASILETVIKLGPSQRTIEATYKLGELHEIFAQHLGNAPIPENLSEEQKKQVKTSLLDLAKQLTTQAAKFYKSSYDASMAALSHTEWSVKAYAKLATIDPKTYPPVETVQVDPAYGSHKLTYDKSIQTIFH